jgi:hypothetical protein
MEIPSISWDRSDGRVNGYYTFCWLIELKLIYTNYVVQNVYKVTEKVGFFYKSGFTY